MKIIAYPKQKRINHQTGGSKTRKRREGIY